MLHVPKPIVVGLNPEVMKQSEFNQQALVEQQGYVRILRTDGAEESYGIVVDKPKLLKNPESEIIEEMFNQISSFGFYPVEMEIRTNGVRRLYQHKNTKPVLIEHQK